MSDNTMTINLQAPVFHCKEEEWPKFIVKFQAFLAMKGCAEVDQTNFKSKLPAMEGEELDARTKLGKAKKLAKMKNVMAMAYITQHLSRMARLNAIFNIPAGTGWPTGRACQLFDNFKQKYNPNNKLLRAEMIKKLNKIKPKKGEYPKVMCNKIEALKVKYWDQAEILDNDTIMMHLFLVCTKLYKLELMQA